MAALARLLNSTLLLYPGPAVTLLTFLLFTGLVAAVTWWLTHKDDHGTSAGYFLAGRRLGGVVIAGSLLLTNLSAEQLVGLNGAAFGNGLHVMVWEVLTVVCMVLMAWFFLPRYLRSGIATVPQFLEVRFGPSTRAITTLIFLLAYAVILLPIILYAGATGLKEMIDISGLTGIKSDTAILWLTVWLVGLIGSVYALFGGLRTVAVSDTLNGVGLLVGGLLITYFGLVAVGEGNGAGAGLEAIRTDQADRLNSIGGPDDSVPFWTMFTGVMLIMTFYWCTNQQIIQRTFGARNLAEGQKGVFLCGALKLLGPIYLVLPGLIAYQLFTSGDIQHIKGDNSYGALVAHVLPDWLVGFFAAVVVGAILSSFNSALNATTTLFSLGIYKARIKPEATEQQVVTSGKWFGWGIAVVAMTIAPLLAQTQSIFQYLQTMNAIYFIPLLAVVVVGMLTKRVTAKAANTGLIVALVLLMAGYFIPIGNKVTTDEAYVPAAQAQAMIDGGAVELARVESPPTLAERQAAAEEGRKAEPAEFVKLRTTNMSSKTISGDLVPTFHYVAIVFVLAIGIMLAIGAVAPRPEPWVHEHSGDVDVKPWKYSYPVGIALLVLVFVIYLVFADFTVLGG
ncbi:MAG: solute:sodium symporter family transporter [Planctomycetota bacterium]